jgi:hypothetical protein
MKKSFATILLTAYFMLMSTLGIIASVPGSVERNAKESIRREIIRSISCPDFITSDTKVKAIVQVDESGNVNVLDINAENAQLKEYVTDQLHHLKIKNHSTEENFVLVINFKIA